MASVGTAVFVRVDARKGTRGAHYMEILIIRDSETQPESHPLAGNPPPHPLPGVQPNHWKQTRGLGTVITLQDFCSDQVCPQQSLKIVF